MITTGRATPLLQGITLTALTAAAMLLAWPARVDVVPEAPSLPPAGGAGPAMASSSAALTDSVVDANIFSRTREAPESRTFVASPTDVPVDEPSTSRYGAGVDISDTASMSSPGADPVPGLYGVVTGPLGRAALLRLDPNVAGSRLFRLGEGAAGYRVRSIGADRVELNGPTGTIVLELVAKGDTP